MIKKNGLRNDSKGVALVIVIMVIIMLTLLGGFAANLAYNQRRLLDIASGRHIRNYYAAQAGVVDASWRIRTNYTGATSCTPGGLGGDFTNVNYSPTYLCDLNNDGVMIASITIGPANLSTGVRQIKSEGLDT